MVKDLKAFAYYKIGEFVADVMLSGVIHPDMSLDNISFRKDGTPAFLDFPEIEVIPGFPENMNEEHIRQLTESLFSVLDGMSDSFSYSSFFRAGFLAEGGKLSWILFANAINNGYSSRLFTKRNGNKLTFDVKSVSVNPDGIIKEWASINKNKILIQEYPTLEVYSQSRERKTISESNRFYLDMLYLSRSCLVFNDIEEAEPALSSVLFNMSCISTKKGLPCTEMD